MDDPMFHDSAPFNTMTAIMDSLQQTSPASFETTIEYGLIAAGIAVAIIVAVGLLGDELAVLFNSISSEI